MTEPTNNRHYIELAARTGPGFLRNTYAPAGEAARQQWRERFETDAFASICRYDQPNPNGRVFCPDFVIDIDVDGDLASARQQTLAVCRLLEKRLGIDPASIAVYFSGAKGFHLIVFAEVFALTPTDNALPVWKRLAQRLHDKYRIAGIDTAIYHPRALLRLPNCRHSGSGRYKVAVEFAELRDFDIDYVLELAQRPREETCLAEITESPKAMGWIREARRRLARRPRRSANSLLQDDGWRTPPCVRRIERGGLPDHHRHDIYFAIARFYATTGMSRTEAVERLRLIDAGNPIRDPDYIERTVRNAWRRPGFEGCPNPYLKAYCDHTPCDACTTSTDEGTKNHSEKGRGQRDAHADAHDAQVRSDQGDSS